MRLSTLTLTETRRSFRWLCYFVFFLSILPVAIYSYKRPAYNWDMLAYMALVVKVNVKDVNNVHTITYSKAMRVLPPDAYDKLINGTAARKDWASNVDHFNDELAFYVVKPLYIWSSYAFYKA